MFLCLAAAVFGLRGAPKVMVSEVCFQTFFISLQMPERRALICVFRLAVGGAEAFHANAAAWGRRFPSGSAGAFPVVMRAHMPLVQWAILNSVGPKLALMPARPRRLLQNVMFSLNSQNVPGLPWAV